MLYGHIGERRRRVDTCLKRVKCRTRRAASRPSSRSRFTRKTRRSTTCPWTTGLTELAPDRRQPLLLDNFPHIKAYWQMLTPKIAQIALRFGADDLTAQ